MLTLEEAAEVWEVKARHWASIALALPYSDTCYMAAECDRLAGHYTGLAREYRDAHAKGGFER
jgi:hypothetical protein